MHSHPLTIRPATRSDARDLRILAALDGGSTLRGRILLAELDCVPIAAISLATGSLIADPAQRNRGGRTQAAPRALPAELAEHPPAARLGAGVVSARVTLVAVRRHPGDGARRPPAARRPLRTTRRPSTARRPRRRPPSGSPKRVIACGREDLALALLGHASLISGVMIAPGQTALTRMPSSAYSTAPFLVSPRMPCLLAA